MFRVLYVSWMELGILASSSLYLQSPSPRDPRNPRDPRDPLSQR